MATITMVSQFQCSTKFTIRSLCKHVQTNHNATSIDLCTVKHNICGRQLSLHSSSREGLRCLSKPISAVGSGLEVSTDPKDNAITIKNVKILVEYREDDKIQLRVDLTGNETQKVFDQVLTDLARSAPPIPGFRRQKGGILILLRFLYARMLLQEKLQRFQRAFCYRSLAKSASQNLPYKK
ncbi:uncharacterized protein LOC114277245 isoform X4 [Camellia sinensis]|uniref:uncharacterized protein LOC114277245 isoform X4 n=1 Tax=Camellia sinensis TaxID=4442 RepID=UPI001036B124|nr:uncharacterized protein LOC114277245 isoform X4 [Camellia sinensis]